MAPPTCDARVPKESKPVPCPRNPVASFLNSVRADTCFNLGCLCRLIEFRPSRPIVAASVGELHLEHTAC